MLDKLKADANNLALRIGIGNACYDAHQYPTAVVY